MTEDGLSMSDVDCQVDSGNGVISAVQCEVCGALHDAKGDTFVRLLGGIFEGMSSVKLGRGLLPGSCYYCKGCFVRGITKELGIDLSIRREPPFPFGGFK